MNLFQDFGQDRLTVLSHLQRHKHLQNKIKVLEGDVERLNAAGDKLRKSEISDQALHLLADPVTMEDMEQLVATEVRTLCFPLY